MVYKVGYIDFRVKKESKVLGGITSMTLTAENAYFFVELNNLIYYNYVIYILILKYILGRNINIKKWDKKYMS